MKYLGQVGAHLKYSLPKVRRALSVMRLFLLQQRVLFCFASSGHMGRLSGGATCNGTLAHAPCLPANFSQPSPVAQSEAVKVDLSFD